jgi:hypothetical protein
MQDFLRRHIKVVAGFLAVVFVGIVIWVLIYTFVIFHITSVTPSGTVSHLQPQIVVMFNKELSQEGLGIKSDNISFTTAVEGSVLTINLDNYMEPGKTYSITIESVQSTTGDRVKNHVIRFTASDDYTLLNEEDSQIILDRQADKTGLYADPIYQYLPYSTLDYEIKASGGTDIGEVASIEIIIELSASDAKSSRSAAVSRYKREAVKYLSNLEGVNISKYKITTTVIDPIL